MDGSRMQLLFLSPNFATSDQNISPISLTESSGISYSFILFSSRLRAHAYKKIKQYKPVKKKRKKIKYKLLCPRGTQTCALAVANIAHAVREMLDVAKRPIPQG